MTPKDPTDLRIDRALHTLRDAQPSAGFERRLFNSVEARAAAPRRPQHWLSYLNEIGLAAAATLAVLAVAALLFLHRHPAPQLGSGTIAPREHAVEHAPLPQDTAAAHWNHGSTSKSPVLSTGPRASIKSLEASEAACSSIPRKTGCPLHDDSPPVATAGVTPARTPTAPSAASSKPTPDEAALLADLHAPSHPAPPLPLSPEERALQTMLRRRNGANLTALAALSDLNPSFRSAHDAAESADFHTFFNPPLPPQPGDSE
jgi:hypothetical protein